MTHLRRKNGGHPFQRDRLVQGQPTSPALAHLVDPPVRTVAATTRMIAGGRPGRARRNGARAVDQPQLRQKTVGPVFQLSGRVSILGELQDDATQGGGLRMMLEQLTGSRISHTARRPAWSARARAAGCLRGKRRRAGWPRDGRRGVERVAGLRGVGRRKTQRGERRRRDTPRSHRRDRNEARG